jgi:acyl-coenzyme A synthetase/AMP-(fatty) acid ligase
VLYTAAGKHRSAIAVESGDERVTYTQLVAEVDALAAAFQSLDAAPGSRVGICAHNTREHLTALLATYAAGKVWVPLSPRLGDAERNAMVKAAKPSIVVEHDRVGGDSVRGLLQRFVAKGPRPVDRAPEDVQIIKWSGGSTGAPKGVLQSVRCLNAQITTIGRHFEFGPGDVNLVAAPLTHGASCFILPILAVGGRHVLVPQAKAGDVLEAIDRCGVTTAYLPPTMIYGMLEEHAHRAARTAHRSLRHLIYSAAPMPPERIARCAGCSGRSSRPRTARWRRRRS